MHEHQQIQQSRKPDTVFQKQVSQSSPIHTSNPYSIIQRAKINPKSLTHADVMQLQRTIGNRAVAQLLSGIVNSSAVQQATVQRQEIPEKEEPLQGKMIKTIQRQEIPEEEPLQGKFESIQCQEIPEEKETCPSCMQRQEIPEEEEPLQGKMIETIQRQEIPEEEEPLQRKLINTVQRQEIPEEKEPLQPKRENNTGIPDNLKAGVENLSGIDMNDVRVHYNSSKPAEVGALAYTQGTNIHVAPGQEKHLPHEAWHVVQQKHGRVQMTTQMKGLDINNDPSLEHEADMMGAKATEQININSKASCFYNERVHESGGVKQLLRVSDDHVRGDLRHPEYENLFTENTVNDINTRLAPNQISTVSNPVLEQAINQSRAANQMDYLQLSQQKVTSEKQMTNFLNTSPDNEHMYVLDTDELHVAIRAETQKLPHPTLVGGDPDVECAGTLRYDDGEVVVTCSSGHFRPPTEGKGKKHVAKMMKKTAKKSYKKTVTGKRR